MAQGITHETLLIFFLFLLGFDILAGKADQ